MSIATLSTLKERFAAMSDAELIEQLYAELDNYLQVENEITLLGEALEEEPGIIFQLAKRLAEIEERRSACKS